MVTPRKVRTHHYEVSLEHFDLSIGRNRVAPTTD
jgi:hypothetical protein